jgi:hypothetical protein
LGAAASVYERISTNMTVGMVKVQQTRWAQQNEGIFHPSVFGQLVRRVYGAMFDRDLRVSLGTSSVGRSFNAGGLMRHLTVAGALTDTIPNVLDALDFTVVASKIPRRMSSTVTGGRLGSLGLADDKYLPQYFANDRVAAFRPREFMTVFPPNSDRAISDDDAFTLTQVASLIIKRAVLPGDVLYETSNGTPWNPVAMTVGTMALYHPVLAWVGSPMTPSLDDVVRANFPLPTSTEDGRSFYLTTNGVVYVSIFRALKVSPIPYVSLVLVPENITYERPDFDMASVAGYSSSLIGGLTRDPDAPDTSPEPDNETSSSAKTSASLLKTETSEQPKKPLEDGGPAEPGRGEI